MYLKRRFDASSSKVTKPYVQEVVCYNIMVEAKESSEDFDHEHKQEYTQAHGVELHPPRTEPLRLKIPQPVTEQIYKHKIPFPRSLKKSKHELEEARCNEMMDKVMIEIPVNAVKISPPLERYVKRLVANDVCGRRSFAYQVHRCTPFA